MPAMFPLQQHVQLCKCGTVTVAVLLRVGYCSDINSLNTLREQQTRTGGFGAHICGK